MLLLQWSFKILNLCQKFESKFVLCLANYLPTFTDIYYMYPIKNVLKVRIKMLIKVSIYFFKMLMQKTHYIHEKNLGGVSFRLLNNEGTNKRKKEGSDDKKGKTGRIMKLEMVIWKREKRSTRC